MLSCRLGCASFQLSKPTKAAQNITDKGELATLVRCHAMISGGLNGVPFSASLFRFRPAAVPSGDNKQAAYRHREAGLREAATLAICHFESTFRQLAHTLERPSSVQHGQPFAGTAWQVARACLRIQQLLLLSLACSLYAFTKTPAGVSCDLRQAGEFSHAASQQRQTNSLKPGCTVAVAVSIRESVVSSISVPPNRSNFPHPVLNPLYNPPTARYTNSIPPLAASLLIESASHA